MLLFKFPLILNICHMLENNLKLQNNSYIKQWQVSAHKKKDSEDYLPQVKWSLEFFT